MEKFHILLERNKLFLRCWTIRLIALVGIVMASNVAEWESV